MTDTAPICPVCEEAELIESGYQGRLDHAGQTLDVRDLECWQCPDCGADPVFPDQARRNHRRYQDVRRRADGLLTSDQILRILDRLGITQVQAAEIFGGGQNAFSKYVRGEVIQSKGMDRLLRLAEVDRRNFERLKEWAGLETRAVGEVREISQKRTTVVPLRRSSAPGTDYRRGAETGWHRERRRA